MTLGMAYQGRLPHDITSDEREAIRKLVNYVVPQLDLQDSVEARGELEYACAVLTSALRRLSESSD